MKMTRTEERLFKEKVIREYKLKQPKKKPSPWEDIRKRLKQLAPVNIIVGILAAIGIVLIKDWQTLVYLLLYGIVWLTLITALVSVLFDKK